MKTSVLSLMATLAWTAACAGPGQVAEKLRSERQAEMTAFKDEMRSEIADLKRAVEDLTKAQAELRSRQVAQVAPRPPSRPSRPDPEAVYSIPINEAPVLGPRDAWVTIVEISDFQCPFCARAQSTLQQVRDTYGDDVRMVFKHNPLSFHARAMPAAMAAECAGEQQQFWSMHHLIFENQRDLEDEDLIRYASKLNLDIGRWRNCFEDGRYASKIKSDQDYAMKIGARGTPTFYINGRVLSGAQPFSRFDALIREELEKAKSSGVSRADYYESAVVGTGRKEM